MIGIALHLTARALDWADAQILGLLAWALTRGGRS